VLGLEQGLLRKQGSLPEHGLGRSASPLSAVSFQLSAQAALQPRALMADS
jgi:hypothetical protein